MLNSLRNTEEHWGAVSQLLHWAIVVLLAAGAGLGLWMVDLANTPRKIELYALHKSLGITLLALVALRLGWRLYAGAPLVLPGTPPLQARIAKFTHAAMYVVLIAMPFTGWLLNSAAGYPLRWFGLFTLPGIAASDRELRVLAGSLHEAGFWVLLALVIVHAGAAFYHHLFLHDATLTRMLPRRRSRSPSMPQMSARKSFSTSLPTSRWLAMAVAACALIGSVPAFATDYVQMPGSSLTFATHYEGELFTGHFSGFTTRLKFDPSQLAEARLDVTIALATASTANDDRDETLRGPDFFDAGRFAQAHYHARAFRHLGGNRYTADGTLRLRGTSRPVTFTFTWTPGAQPVLSGNASVQRLDFGIGGGDWADLALIPNPVAISTRVLLAPVTPMTSPRPPTKRASGSAP